MSRTWARRLAVANFVAFAPDALSTLGGYPGDEEKAVAMFGQLDRPKMMEDFAALSRLAEGAAGRATASSAAVGFCFGRWRRPINWRCAWAVTLLPGYRSMAHSPSRKDAAKIKTPINAQYGRARTRASTKDGRPSTRH